MPNVATFAIPYDLITEAKRLKINRSKLCRDALQAEIEKRRSREQGCE